MKEFTIATLSDVLGGRDYDELTGADLKAYNDAFAAFKQVHCEKFPNGQLVKLPIKSITLQEGYDGNYRFTMIAHRDAASSQYKFRAATLDIMLRNALNLPLTAAAATIIGAKDKGFLVMTVKVVDETDVYIGRDGTEGNYSRPQVAVQGNVEYVSSSEVSAEVAGLMKFIAKEQLKMQIASISNHAPAATAAAAQVITGDDDEPNF